MMFKMQLECPDFTVGMKGRGIASPYLNPFRTMLTPPLPSWLSCMVSTWVAGPAVSVYLWLWYQLFIHQDGDPDKDDRLQ